MLYPTIKTNAYEAQTKVKALQDGTAMHDVNRSPKTEDSFAKCEQLFNILKPNKYVQS